MRWLILVAVLSVAVGAEEGPRAKDEREYALVQQAIGERDPAKRLGTLETWSKEYEETQLGEMRAKLFLQTYREAGQSADAVQAAERVLALAPDDFAAHYTLASLAPVLGSTEDSELVRAERSAGKLLDSGIEVQFDPTKRPENVPAETWESAARESRATSLRTLGWIAMQRKQHEDAEARLTEALEVEPTSAQTSYWLAQSVLAQRNPDKNELAFFSLARAATLTGKGELPADSREKIHAYLRKTYEAFAGSLDGLEEIERLAADSALPPVHMPRIASAQERRIDEEKRFCEQKPLECAYRNLRAALEGGNGEGVWADLRGKMTPPMRLYVVANEPPDRPLALRLAAAKGGKAEVVLRLANRLRAPMPVGRLVKFEGVATGLTRAPFVLTLEQGRVLD